MAAQDQAPHFDPAGFSTAPHAKKIDKPWGWELHWVPEDAPYMGKVLHINQGKRLSLQVHDEKQESWFLMNGQAAVIWENEKGELVETMLEAGKGYSTKIGQKHRLKGITDCDILEVSTPELGTTWRLEDAQPNARRTRRRIRAEFQDAVKQAKSLITTSPAPLQGQMYNR